MCIVNLYMEIVLISFLFLVLVYLLNFLHIVSDCVTNNKIRLGLCFHFFGWLLLRNNLWLSFLFDHRFIHFGFSLFLHLLIFRRLHNFRIRFNRSLCSFRFHCGLFLHLSLLFHYFRRGLRLLRIIGCRVGHSGRTSLRGVSLSLRVMGCTFVTANIIERWQVTSTSLMNRDRAFLNFYDVRLIRLMLLKFSHEFVFVQVGLESKYFLCNLLVVSLDTF